MANYDALTPERFKQLKPQFENVDDAVVQSYIDMAAVFVDKSWPVSVYEQAWSAMVCHLMTLDGLGTDAQSKANASGASEYSSIKSGNLTLTRFKAEAGNDTPYLDWLRSTSCGKYYAVLLQMAKRGPRVAVVSSGCGPSGFAKDWCGPAYGWPGVFY